MNNTLPMYNKLNEVLDAVKENSVVIVRAETGSGKSTQIPQALYYAGYEVIVTQPRRVAAMTVASRVAVEMGVRLGDLVGYRTGFEREDSKETKILFCTDGLELARELASNETEKKRVICIDEIHEWNMNMEALVAWCKHAISTGSNIKLVIMSATIDTTNLQRYFFDCPVIDVPGTLYSVTMNEISKSELENKLKEVVKLGKNILVFLPEKSEIVSFIEEFSELNANLIPFYGELSLEEQEKAFDHYPVSKIIVATNIAQTSITIPDVDVVFDFGLEKRIEIFNGIQGLYLHNISQADCLQRKGRAGRVKSGEYYLVSDVKFDKREKFSTPEIQRLRIESIVLKFLSCGLDIEDVELFHSVELEKIEKARATLKSIGAISCGKITEIGMRISKMPLEVELSRMLIEAEKRGCLKDAILVASILQVGFLFKREARIPKLESGSDIVNYVKIFNQLENEYFISRDYSSDMFKQVNIKNYKRILEIRRKICEYYERENVRVVNTSKDKNDLIISFATGYRKNIYHYEGRYMNITEDRHNTLQRWVVDKKSCAGGSSFVIGIPKNLVGKFGEINLLTWCTDIDDMDLLEKFSFIRNIVICNYRAYEDFIVEFTYDDGSKCVVDTLPARKYISRYFEKYLAYCSYNKIQIFGYDAINSMLESESFASLEAAERSYKGRFSCLKSLYDIELTLELKKAN